MTLQELKKLILTSKKDDKELSVAYSMVLKQIESATIGVKNAETDEKKLILSDAKKELKEQCQSKSLNAPYSQKTIDICNIIIVELQPSMVTEQNNRL